VCNQYRILDLSQVKRLIFASEAPRNVTALVHPLLKLNGNDLLAVSYRNASLLVAPFGVVEAVVEG
jgi:hypothetical protein